MIYFIKFSALNLSIKFAGLSSFLCDPNNEKETRGSSWQFFATFALVAIERREAHLEDPREARKEEGRPAEIILSYSSTDYRCLCRLLTRLHDYSSITTTLYLEIRVASSPVRSCVVAFYEEREIVAVPVALHDALSNVRLLYRIVINLCYTSMCKNR